MLFGVWFLDKSFLIWSPGKFEKLVGEPNVKRCERLQRRKYRIICHHWEETWINYDFSSFELQNRVTWRDSFCVLHPQFMSFIIWFLSKQTLLLTWLFKIRISRIRLFSSLFQTLLFTNSVWSSACAQRYFKTDRSFLTWSVLG